MVFRFVLLRVLAGWWPAALVMAVIFLLSSRPADALPNLGWADILIKKGGHVLGYAVLAVTYWRGMDWQPPRLWFAWTLAAVYGFSDEIHQSFVAGRGASAWDVILFDAPGALLGLWSARNALRRGMTSQEEFRARTCSWLGLTRSMGPKRDYSNSSSISSASLQSSN
jgi:VanZ family protein